MYRLRGIDPLSRQFVDAVESRIMGHLLQKAVAEASKLPEAEQEAVGAWILAGLESEWRWDDLFARSHDMLAEMAAEAIREDEAGLTRSLDPDDI
jgi:hypothetical protein